MFSMMLPYKTKLCFLSPKSRLSTTNGRDNRIIMYMIHLLSFKKMQKKNPKESSSGFIHQYDI